MHLTSKTPEYSPEAGSVARHSAASEPDIANFSSFDTGFAGQNSDPTWPGRLAEWTLCLSETLPRLARI